MMCLLTIGLVFLCSLFMFAFIGGGREEGRMKGGRERENEGGRERGREVVKMEFIVLYMLLLFDFNLF